MPEMRRRRKDRSYPGNKSPTKTSKDIRSGYDVRLLADLVEMGLEMEDLPTTRVGLYDAVLATARGADGLRYPLPDLCKIAWEAWTKDRRDLVRGENIADTLLDPLLREGTRIVRTRDGKHYEFRHDQMRGYLAARWAATHEVSPIDLFERTPEIWRLGRVEQQVVWGFFAELIKPERGQAVWDWSEREAERAELQVALRHVAMLDGWASARRSAITV